MALLPCMSHSEAIDGGAGRWRRARESSASNLSPTMAKRKAVAAPVVPGSNWKALQAVRTLPEPFPRSESSLSPHHQQAIKPTSAKATDVKEDNKRKRRHSSVGTDASVSSERQKSRKGKERADEAALERVGAKEKKARGDKKLVPVEEIMAGGSGAWQQECVPAFPAFLRRR